MSTHLLYHISKICVCMSVCIKEGSPFFHPPQWVFYSSRGRWGGRPVEACFVVTDFRELLLIFWLWGVVKFAIDLFSFSFFGGKHFFACHGRKMLIY